LELKAHLQAQVDGTSKIKYFHNVRKMITLVWDTSLNAYIDVETCLLDRSRRIHFSSPWVLANCGDGLAWNVSLGAWRVHFAALLRFFWVGVPKYNI
jgi:hypothetical protein